MSGNENLIIEIQEIINKTEEADLINTIIKGQIESISKYDDSIYSKLSSIDFIEHLLNSDIMNQSELAEYLEAKSIKGLRELAVKTESYFRVEKKLPNLNGGLHYYINSLTSNEIIDYILSKAQELPLITTEKFLDN